MTIQINNLTVNNNAPRATIIGVLAAYDASGTVIPCTFTLKQSSAGLFAISGNNLVTAFSGSPMGIIRRAEARFTPLSC